MASAAATAPRPAGGRGALAGLGLPALGWVLYDLANTIFSYAVVTRYFNEWIIFEQGQPDLYVGLMSLAVSVALVLSLPFLGALADARGRRMPFLIVATVACVVATALLGFVEGVFLALLVGGVAIFAFNSALAHYDPLLSVVAPPERRGLVSGVGVGAGYVGVLMALVVFGQLVPDGDNQRAFLPTAVLFLVLSIPCFLWVRDRPGLRSSRARARPPAGVVKELVASVRRARRARYGRLLVARFFYVDALATVIVYMTVYARRTGDFTGSRVEALLASAVAFAVLGGLVAGALVERLGPKRVLTGTLLLVAATLLATGLSGQGELLWIAGPAVGVGLGAVWTSDRVFLLRLCPEEHRGEAFGLYTLIGKASSGIGPLVLWGGSIFVLTEVLGLLSPYGASRVAICLLAVAALVGLALLRPLSDSAAEPPPSP